MQPVLVLHTHALFWHASPLEHVAQRPPAAPQSLVVFPAKHPGFETSQHPPLHGWV